MILQHDVGQIIVVIADAELAPFVDAVQLLPQGGVQGIVKIQASNPIAAFLLRMRVNGRHCGQTLPDGYRVRFGDAVLNLVPVLHRLHSFPWMM